MNAPVDQPQSSTFLFADLAGFTALTEAHGDEQAADLADEFSRAARTLLPDYGAEQIKAIGDALMLRVHQAGDAVRLGCALSIGLLADHGYPAIRVGMHHGPAIERDGDWFGASVNLAARISGLATGGEVLLSAATWNAAGELPDVRFSDHGLQRFRNVADPVQIFAAAADSNDEGDTPVDPVCRMLVDPDPSTVHLVYECRTYYFCSMGCVARFATAPLDYVDEA